ncbi:MAG: uncharacterized protein QOI36_2778 [Pseudonocardiales bacterium]|nr:uncharacterized protein [Pseudonocardiales bacterium]
MLSVKHLITLRDLAEHGTVAAVAELHSLTVSSVSKNLRVLEAEVGSPLLRRPGGDARQATPQPAGPSSGRNAVSRGDEQQAAARQSRTPDGQFRPSACVRRLLNDARGAAQTEAMTTVSGPTSARQHGLADDEPVTVVFSWRAKPGKENEFAKWAKGLASAAAHFPGNLSVTVIHEQGSRDFHIIVQFVNREALQRWLDSRERARLHDKVRDIADARTAVQQRTGLETWFYVPAHAGETIKPPPRWKQWLVSLVAVYPLVLLFQAFIAPWVAGWPLWARSAMFPLIILTLMTYVVMPLVSRLLGRWLYTSS